MGHDLAPGAEDLADQIAEALRQIPDIHPIPDFPGYWITKDARVYSTKLTGGRGGKPRHAWLTQRRHPRTGHLRVDMRDKDCRRCTIQVQRLVAWTFLGPQPEGTYVCHIDGNETNNEPENLYYGTPEDNAQDREWHKLCREEGWYMRDDRDVVYQVDPELGF